jgi:hypothetical protein
MEAFMTRKVLLYSLLFFSFFLATNTFSQTNFIIFDGNQVNKDWNLWEWGFNAPVTNYGSGYCPGGNTFMWSGCTGAWVGHAPDWPDDMDFTEIMKDTLHFKFKAYDGLVPMQIDFRDAANYRLTYFFDTTYVYSKIVENEWVQIDIPMSAFVNDEGYNGATPFDTTKVSLVAFENSQSGILPSKNIYFDDIHIGRPEVRRFPVFFTGKAWSGGLTAVYEWGFGSTGILEGGSPVPGMNAYYCTLNGNGWSGFAPGFRVLDLTGASKHDTLKFKMKAPAGFTGSNSTYTHTMRFRTHGGENWRPHFTKELKEDVVVFDGNWQQVNLPLKDFVDMGGADWAQVHYLTYDIYLDGTNSSDTLFFTDMWVGNPVLDITAPETVAKLEVIKDTYINYIVWEDVPGETGEKYILYESSELITDLTAPGVSKLATISEGVEVYTQMLFTPLEDLPVTKYYAMEVMDNVGNISITFTATQEATVNNGKGRPVIALARDMGTKFTADGDLSEWEGIKPTVIKPSENSVLGGSFDNDADYTASCYVAIDDSCLYVALDVIDDIFAYDPATIRANWWEIEYFELDLGLYNQTKINSGFGRGDEPVYRLIFLPDSVIENTKGVIFLYALGENYFFSDLGGQDFVAELKIPFSYLQYPEDKPFIPVDGMTLPFNILGSDCDAEDGVFDGAVQLANTTSWPSWGSQYWTFTWLEDLTTGVEDNPININTYSLSANYPNPFNPATKIKYSIANSEIVNLSIYNILGQKVQTLVNEFKTAGKYEVTFNAASLPSGVFFYTITSGDFSSTKKMILLK